MKLLPMLFNKGERNFSTEGLGRLSDALTCTVTETRNSDTEFELVMTYPIGGVLYEELAIDMVIGCYAHKHDTEIEAFRIYMMEDDMVTGTSTIYARQVGMMLASQTAITNFHVNGDAESAMLHLGNHLAWYNTFQWLSLSSDITDTKTIDCSIPQKLTEYLISDTENGMLVNYGGEFKWHLYDIQLLKERGLDNGGVVRYGKNMTSLRRTRDSSDVVTAVLPYYAKEREDGAVYLITGNDSSTGMIFHAEHQDTYYPHISIIDCTSDILAPEGASNEWVPTAAYINEYAGAYLEMNVTGEIPVTYEATVVDDPETVDVELHLCDTVLLQHPSMGVNVKAKITQTVYNVLSDQWESIKIGNVRSNLAGTIYDLYDRRPTITRIQTGGGTSGTEGDWTWSIDGNLAKISYSKNISKTLSTRYGSYYYISEPITISTPQYFSSGWTANRTSLTVSFATSSGVNATAYVYSYESNSITLYLVSTRSGTTTGTLKGSVVMTKNQS